ncbi:MAG: hypothetical protein ACK2U9_02220 [Anaerolineae bacterium]
MKPLQGYSSTWESSCQRQIGVPEQSRGTILERVRTGVLVASAAWQNKRSMGAHYRE